MFGNYGIMNKEEKKQILAKCDGDIFGNDCVMWTGRRHSSIQKGNQHGKWQFKGKSVYVHRLLYHNFVEPLSVEKPCILHSCDTDGRCVCLKHLRAGTHKENTADMTAHGNQFIPERKTLTENNVRSIRKRYREGEDQLTLAKAFKISKCNISRIVNRKRWNKVED